MVPPAVIFPIDTESLNYLRLSGRSESQIALVQAYAKAQGLWYAPNTPPPSYSTTLELNMNDIKPSLAGPKRPQDRVLLQDMQNNYREHVRALTTHRTTKANDHDTHPIKGQVDLDINGQTLQLKDGAVVIAAITSCTNTSNPAVMFGAGLLGTQCRCQGTATPTLGQNLACPWFACCHGLPGKPACSTIWRHSGSTWLATAALPASEILGHCPQK